MLASVHDTHSIRAAIKRILVDTLALDIPPEQIRDDDALFAHGMGVDSAEALEIVTAVEAHFGIRIHEEEIGLAMFQDVTSIAAVVEEALAAKQGLR
jgi:acyl carrier protein